jgi:hypothetical protein
MPMSLVAQNAIRVRSEHTVEELRPPADVSKQENELDGETVRREDATFWFD